jgi:hypothetical protein
VTTVSDETTVETRRGEFSVRLLDRLLRPTVARLLAERIEEERLDALYRYRVHSDPARLRIHPTAVVNNAIFNTGGGHITVGEYVFFGHNVCVLAGVHEVDKFGLDRQRAIPRSGYDIDIGEGAWLATNVLERVPRIIRSGCGRSLSCCIVMI